MYLARALLDEYLWSVFPTIVEKQAEPCQDRGDIRHKETIGFLWSTLWYYFFKINIANLWVERAPLCVLCCTFNFSSRNWRLAHATWASSSLCYPGPEADLPVGSGNVEDENSRKLLDKRVLLTHLQNPLMLKVYSSWDLGWDLIN